MKGARIDTVLDQLTLSLGPALAARASGNAETAAVIASALGLLDAQLLESSYLAGDALSLADLGVGAALNDAGEQLLDQYPSIRRWLKNVRLSLCETATATTVLSATATSKEWTAARVRSTFLEFFEGKGHTRVPSSPVVPIDDPTLLFANAGMNQFKPIFLGTVDPSNPLSKLKSACDTQKCIRAGGKHNDLEDVGKDTYHHTFFEMLGNWSFGDYFKKEAIAYAWELLTEVYMLPKARLYATYFGGDPKQGLPPDDEAKEIWLKYLPEDRVLPFDCKDNFWEMGDVGPCGPCTEIHFDRIGDRFVPELVNADDPTLIEIWNVVFIQFNREQGGTLKNLPAKHVDTGMGFERIASILQNKMSNYDTDVFVPLFDAIKAVSGARPYAGRLGAEDEGSVDMAYRVVADHIRTLSFAIADGARPGNEGREYVLRRILRRAVRFGQQNLGAPAGFFAKLVDPFVALMGDVFPELRSQAGTIHDVIADEETAFGRTLQRGIERFGKAAKAAKGGQISGKEAFMLYDTFGFPVDLTQLMAEERGMNVDMDGFNEAMAHAKKLARAGRKVGAAVELKMEAEQTSYLQKKGISPTDDSPKFLERDIDTVLCAILTKDGFVESTAGLDVGDAVGLVLRATTFYAEQGGQTFDCGSLVAAASGSTFAVVDTRTAAGFVLHVSQVPGEGAVKVGDAIRCSVDYERRRLILPNHSFTHVLNLALRSVLGDGSHQKGSLNDPEKLRFDFSHNKAMSLEQLRDTEDIVRRQLTAAHEVHTKEVSLASAMEINTLRAVFGETYPDPVRVVSIGVPVDDLIANPKNPDWMQYSVEFCGGTHLKNTSEAGAFALLSEEAVGKGIRRLTAVTGKLATDAIDEGKRLEARVSAAEAMTDAELSKELNELKNTLEAMVVSTVVKQSARARVTALTKRLADATKRQATENKDRCVAAVSAAADAAASAGRSAVVLDAAVGLDNAALKAACNAVKLDIAVVLLSCDAEKDRIVACASVPKALQAKIDSNKLLRASLAPVDGKGGGKNGFAIGQGVGSARLEACISGAKAFLKDFVHEDDGAVAVSEGPGPAPSPPEPVAAAKAKEEGAAAGGGDDDASISSNKKKKKKGGGCVIS